MKTLSSLRDILGAVSVLTLALASPATSQDFAFHLVTDDPGRTPSPFFLMLSETPDKRDVVNFVTGAGGFLQQVIYGYTGLRWGEKGLEPQFAPVLPSRITRLTLRRVYSRRKRYDVIVDASGRRMVPSGSD
jgi:hypothetical protein